jgi:alpha-L-rhamnosidase
VGMLNAQNWKAKWIRPGYVEDTVLRPSPLMRKVFKITKPVESATLFISSCGLYNASMNGVAVTNAYLTPGFTSYQKRLQYQVYDVSKSLNKGENCIGVSLGSGWYRGNLAWAASKDLYGHELALISQLEIVYADKTRQTVISDESWSSSTGEIQSSEIYHGETVDARLEKTGWLMPAYDDKNWMPVKTAALKYDNLIATVNEPVTIHEQLKPLRIFKTPLGEQVIDFGQNMVGFVQVKASGKAGDKIVLQHAEVLDKAGNFYTANLRAAKQTNTYILSGKGTETFEPRFTFQGFRYIKIEGYPGEIKPENFTAMVLHSDMRPTGSFTTSNPMLNQLQHNIQWGQKGNFVDIPTDCPQRDERLGWTGDAQVFFRTAAYNMQVQNFFRKWLKDVAADQLANGSVPFVIPNMLGQDAAGSTGWADVATIIPWDMYVAYGDKKILEQQYASMKAWVGYMQQKSDNDLWHTGFHFGDWLFYHPDDDNDGRAAITDKYLIAQCFYAHSVQLLINAAGVLGNSADVNNYSALLKKLKTAFVQEYLTPNGRLVSGSQTAYVLALHFDMLPESLRANAAKRLAENIASYNYHLTTGFLGTPYLCHVLTRFGYNDLAYTLLMQDTYPSWLYPVKMGATTIWERWDGQKPDSSFQTINMNSFNHYAYGAIGDWMYRTLGGIQSDDQEVGYKKIIIHPMVNGKLVQPKKNEAEWDGLRPGAGKTSDSSGLTKISADLETNYGKLSSHWQILNKQIQLSLEIPVNTSATVYLPTNNPERITEGNNKTLKELGIAIKELGADFTAVELGSGKYLFTMPIQ